MSALAMVLTAAMMAPEDGSEKGLGEVTNKESKPLNLQEEWRGTLYICDTMDPVSIKSGHIFFLAGDGSRCRFECMQQSTGTFRVRWFEESCLGIYRYEGEHLLLCLRKASKGRPDSFRIGDDRIVLILRRVKCRK